MALLVSISGLDTNILERCIYYVQLDITILVAIFCRDLVIWERNPRFSPEMKFSVLVLKIVSWNVLVVWMFSIVYYVPISRFNSYEFVF